MPALVRRSITASESRSASAPSSLDRCASVCSLPQRGHRALGRETSASTRSPPSRSRNRKCAKARLEPSSVAWQSIHSKLTRRARMRLFDFGIPSCTPSRSVASKLGYGPRVSWESGQRRHGKPRHDTRMGPWAPSASFRARMSCFPQTRQASAGRLRRSERDRSRLRSSPSTSTTFCVSAFECLVTIGRLGGTRCLVPDERTPSGPLVLKGFAPSIGAIECQLASRILALVPNNPAPGQAREVVSDLSAVQTPPQSARIRRAALAPIPLA